MPYVLLCTACYVGIQLSGHSRPSTPAPSVQRPTPGFLTLRFGKGAIYLPSASAVATPLTVLDRVRASNAAQIRDNEVQHANMMPVMGRSFRRLLAGSSNYDSEGEEQED